MNHYVVNLKCPRFEEKFRSRVFVLFSLSKLKTLSFILVKQEGNHRVMKRVLDMES